MRALVLVALVAACNGFDLPAQPESGARPFANAGTGSSYPLGAVVTLDGSASFDLDGRSMTYRWSLVQAPSGSRAMPADPEAPITSFVPDELGTYRLKLEVTDTALNTDSSEVRIVATGAITSIDAGADVSAQWLSTVQLAGSVDTVPGKLATYTWGVVSIPTGSTASLTDNTLHPSFVADAVGTYVVELTARVGDEARTDEVTVTVTAAGISIGTNVTAYVYSPTVDRVFYLHDVGYAEIVKLEPTTGFRAGLNVGAFTPRSLSIDALQQYVAVGGVGKVALVAMNAFVLGTVRDAPGCTAAHVLSPAQYAVYCFPADGATEPITTVYMNTGQVVQSPSPVRFPDVGIDGSGFVYMLDSASSSFYVYDGTSTPPFATPRTQLTIAGVTSPLFVLGENQAYALAGNGLALYSNGSVHFDLHTPVEKAGDGPTALAVVSGTQLKIFSTFPTPMLVQTAVIPAVDGMTPTTRLVAYSTDGHSLIIVAGTSEGDVLYTVPR